MFYYNQCEVNNMCVFCEITKGNIPSHKVYEDENCIAILDISQANKGHTLIIPKVHAENILKIDGLLLAKLAEATKAVTCAIGRALGINDFNIINNCGLLAGQTVNHFHIHILPRTKDDKIKLCFPANNPSEDEFVSLENKIKEELKKI